MFRRAVLVALKQMMGDSWSAFLEKSWGVLLDTVSDIMIEGIEKAVKRVEIITTDFEVRRLIENRAVQIAILLGVDLDWIAIAMAGLALLP